MNLRFFDFEVFPHWWLCVFGDMPDTNTINEDISPEISKITVIGIEQKLLNVGFYLHF